MPLPLFGFTLLRNALKYDYCYLESLTSLSHVVDETFLALGKGEDSTESTLSKIPRLNITSTVWDENLRAGAIILSEQTNIALSATRKYAKENGFKNAWGIYLQADEVLHQDDIELIKRDIEQAEIQGCDALSFRYFHFWQTHHDIAINKKWYPQEIRAIRLFPRVEGDSFIESWGDAQSFRNYRKIFFSEARIYHYGHVREPSKYQEKKKDIMELYHEKKSLQKYRKREKRFDDQTEVIKYFGTHPFLMKERILRFGDVFELDPVDLLYIVAEPLNYSAEFSKNILSKKVLWTNSLWEVPLANRASAVIIKNSLFSKLLYPSSVPQKMRSKLALPWNAETYLMLKMSEKGVGLGSRHV